ncbi:MAG: nucleotidyltransferase family protein [Candidatus Zhuqueibacterota bacterium]
MTLAKFLQNNRDEILAISKKHGAFNIRIFGSIARDEYDDLSDIDILVDVESGTSLFDLGGLSTELENLLGRKVDIVTERGLRNRIRDKILKEAKPL